ncbi:MAG: DUF3750 domain-containing protein [Magnetovibrio sp.]|nr:DUF3750 domain-containing protein [Magnetovibrio sp.]
MTWWRRRSFWLKTVPLALLIGLFGIAVVRHSMADWRTASMESAGIAPDPAAHPEAVIQVYAARAYSWRGIFGVHTWFAVKPTGADAFAVYEVIGWRVRRGGKALAISNRPADGRWFDAVPEIIADVRGDGVDEMIQRIDRAAGAYPYMDEYRVWPGPNSNTFTAHVARAVPELRLDLPPTAIGKDYIPGGIVAKTPSGTGVQVSLAGLLGLMVGKEEGVEINLLGLTFGIDPLDLTVKLPMAGRIGGES